MEIGQFKEAGTDYVTRRIEHLCQLVEANRENIRQLQVSWHGQHSASCVLF